MTTNYDREKKDKEFAKVREVLFGKLEAKDDMPDTSAIDKQYKVYSKDWQTRINSFFENVD